MGTQTLLVLGALTIIGGFILVVNTTLFNTSERINESTAFVAAQSLAESLISEARIRRFDNVTNITSPSSLTNASSLGKETGETYPNFNDIDDYNGYVDSNRVVNGIRFIVRAQVFYAALPNLETPQSSQTYLKHLIVRVKSPMMTRLRDSIMRLDYIASHQNIFGQQQTN